MVRRSTRTKKTKDDDKENFVQPSTDSGTYQKIEICLEEIYAAVIIQAFLNGT